ncbi:MAG TPA: secretin N-terminal domain-containing protein [Verrucomicrobiae bacterium]|jgi:general secretion pathway protein D|nr:secretin N-terminal domain-containing protein [Verrucomicrobiae bacterium]
MKTTILALILFLTGLDLWAQTTPTLRSIPRRASPANNNNPMATPSNSPATAAVPATETTVEPADESSDGTSTNAQPEEMIPAGNINFQGVDVSQVLEVYAKLVGRTLLRAGLPSASIVLKTETPLTKTEAIEALQAVLSLNGIQVINIGDKFVKVLSTGDANTAAAEFNDKTAAQLPDLGPYVTHIVQLKNIKPTEMVPIIQPFAKLPNAILPIDSNGILVLRDNAENVKRMLQMIDRVDVSVPAEYISEVIPIKYALAEDIANALNSLGGTGSGSTVSIGGSTSGTANGTRTGTTGTTGGNGFGTQQRAGGTTGAGGNTGFGATANGAAGGGASTFQQRLQSIIQRAAGGGQQDQIQVFGQTKIIADQRSNSLLVFATRDDMERIKEVVSKLDVLLSQVLIESVIMEVSLGKSLSTGVSAVQNPSAINVPNFKGGGGYNNGPSFLSFLASNVVSTATNGNTSFGSALASGGFSYFGQLGNSDYDIAVQAAASDNDVTIIQKPRIQTFQAQEASFFVGQTVPYVTSTYNGGTTGIGSSFSQLSVGVSLDVTPFINPDGLVVMQINEEIDDLNGTTFIQGVGNVPNTDKRTLVSNVAVKDRDSIILGGAIRSEKDHSSSGVPILQDIPLLGVLFSAKTSNKTRDELLVLMRPTVLRTPELAAIQAKTEEGRLPGIAHAEDQDNKEEAKQVAAEEKVEQMEADRQAKADAKAAKKHGAIISTNQPPSQPIDMNSTPSDSNDNIQTSPAAGLY